MVELGLWGPEASLLLAAEWLLHSCTALFPIVQAGRDMARSCQSPWLEGNLLLQGEETRGASGPPEQAELPRERGRDQSFGDVSDTLLHPKGKEGKTI